MMPWHASVITLFPGMFPGSLGDGVIGKALSNQWTLDVYDIRAHAINRYGSVDDTPYGGGAGMVIRPDVLGNTIEDVLAHANKPSRMIYPGPRGKVFCQDMARRWINDPHILWICGRYEGIDQRIFDHYPIEEVSLGDFILAGGEVAVLSMIEACVRLLPGVLGNQASLLDESFGDDLLEYPHYTRPEIWNGHEVPDILRSGHHEKIQEWRMIRAKKITKQNRPDLYEKHQVKKNPKGS